MIRRFFLSFVFLFVFLGSYVLNGALISTGPHLYNEIQKNNRVSGLSTQVNGIYLLEVEDKDLPFITMLAHEELHICSGYVYESDELSARISLHHMTSHLKQPRFPEVVFQEAISDAIDEVNAQEIKATIETMSSYQNRYYLSETGTQSQEWLKEKWASLVQSLENAEVELFHHQDFSQPSVILTFHGRSKKEEALVLGGHGDSTSGWFPNPGMLAPGADDNASGIATLTEVVRILGQMNFAPERTVHIMSYAAEEVGLRGSQEIAQKFSREGKDVKGVLQFDMTNFPNSPYDFVLIDDYTTSSLSSHLVSLIETYLPGHKWSYDDCGYACSDHASWYRAGYPVAFPFETTFATHNSKIHTVNDTLTVSDSTASHASKFSKLALAFVLNMASGE